MTPPPLKHFSKNSSDLVALSFPNETWISFFKNWQILEKKPGLQKWELSWKYVPFLLSLNKNPQEELSVMEIKGWCLLHTLFKSWKGHCSVYPSNLTLMFMKKLFLKNNV